VKKLSLFLVAGLALAGCDNNTTTPNTNTGSSGTNATGTSGNMNHSGTGTVGTGGESGTGTGAGGGNVGGASTTNGAGTGGTSSNSGETRPDNTGVNTRDRNGDTKTPIDQQETTADVKTTADIRQKIVNQDGMSINARNVKIMTKDGKVTLRGPVNSEDEKKTIEGFAKNVAGDQNVDSQLEVAPSDK